MFRLPCRWMGFLPRSASAPTQLTRVFSASVSSNGAVADAPKKDVVQEVASKSSSGAQLANASLTPHEIWQRRSKLATPIIQRYERPSPKVYYAPEWESDNDNPMKGYGMTPEKWEYYNKVVWPPNYIVPETGLPKAREVFHCRESVHYSPKRMWNACQLVRRMVVSEALVQLRHKQIKGTLMLAEIIEEAIKRATDEFHIPSAAEKMFVAEAFPIQCKIIKGRRRHARDRYEVTRYRYINIFVRLEEGAPPPYQGRAPAPDSWELMQRYYQYLRNRDVKYSI